MHQAYIWGHALSLWTHAPFKLSEIRKADNMTMEIYKQSSKGRCTSVLFIIVTACRNQSDTVAEPQNNSTVLLWPLHRCYEGFLFAWWTAFRCLQYIHMNTVLLLPLSCPVSQSNCNGSIPPLSPPPPPGQFPREGSILARLMGWGYGNGMVTVAAKNI